MQWFNLYGFIFMLIIMIPNIVFVVRHKDGFNNVWHNRLIEFLEQIGRFSCIGLMIFNIPGTWLGFQSKTAFFVYMIVNCILILSYCLIWMRYFNKNCIFRALALSILPSIIFLFSGIICRYILLAIGALIFAPCHIIISYNNAVKSKDN